MSIHILPEHVAAQIAAGEVVERPASVVKELIENSLDAGARVVRVEVEAGGRKLIRVIDDGCGIPADEAEIAFARHATSKLREIEDLDNIQTLGFRGEALASIAAVAQVTLLTRAADSEAGSLLYLDGGKLLEKRAAGTPVGTTISIENLFFNTPARLKFMKAEATERRHIDTVVTRYAMAYPNVRFTLVQDGRITFSTTGNGDLADVLVEALGLDIMREMIEVAPLAPPRPDLPKIGVYGYTSAPSLNRNTRGHIMLFVNGRYIQDASLAYAVSQAYHTLIPADRYPIAVLMLSMPPADVDVNVHPAKTEVRFRSPDTAFSAVQRAVRRAVIGASSVPTMRAGGLAGIDTRERGAEADEEPRPWRELSQLSPIQGYVPPARQPLDLPDYDAGRYPQHIAPGEQAVQAAPSPSEPFPDADDLESRPRSLPPMRVVGQVGATYIIAEGPAGLYLVDQHAAHERILFEQFMREQARNRPIAQYTLEAFTVQFPPASAHLIEQNLDALRRIGFEIEPFGGNTFRVRAIPAVLADHDPAEAIETVLGDLELGADPAAPTIEARVLLRVCKAAAVKAGQILSYDEMRALMRQLERCDAPRTCPHGRPTMIHISAAQLAREFGRT